MTLRITLGLAVLAATGAVPAAAGAGSSSSKSHQRSTQATRTAAAPDAFERAVNRSGMVPPDVVDRAVMRRNSANRSTAVPDAFERAVNRSGTMPPDVVDRAIMRHATEELEDVTSGGERIVDDWFRDNEVRSAAIEPSPVDRIIAQEQGRVRDPRLYDGADRAVIQVVGPGDGFDWADAGLGVGAGISVVLLATLGGLALRRQMAHGATQS
jgi:hypothetical protein